MMIIIDDERPRVVPSLQRLLVGRLRVIGEQRTNTQNPIRKYLTKHKKKIKIKLKRDNTTNAGESKPANGCAHVRSRPFAYPKKQQEK